MFPVLAAVLSAVAISNMTDQCAAQPALLMCKPVPCAVSSCSVADIPAKAKDADARARANFHYAATVQWRAPADLAHAWTGDCVSLAEATTQILAEQGVPESRLWLMLVSTKMGATQPDHQIAVVEAADGSFWLIGDAHRGFQRFTGSTYYVFYAQRMDWGNEWIEVPSDADVTKLLNADLAL